MPDPAAAGAGPIADAKPGPANEKSTPVPGPGTRRWVVPTAVLVIALALAGVGAWRWFWTPLQARLAQDAARAEEHGRQIDALDAWRSTASEDLAAFESRLRALTQRVDQLGPERLAAWSLAEADYLLRSASRAATFDYDPARAALALQLASATLAPIPGSDALRRAIDGARSALDTVRVPDVAALGGELAQAGEVLREAGLREPGVAPTTPARPGWRGTVQQAWQQLSEVIVVQRVGTPVQPLLRPHETQYLHEQLALKLAAAELALRRRDNAALRRDIADLTDWANAYLDTGPATTAAALATLKRLADTDLRPPLPDLTGLGKQLDALRRRADSDPMP